MPGDAPDFFMRGQIIERIDLIKDISRIGSIYDIVTRPNLVGNYSFETGILEPWFGDGEVTDEAAKLGERSLKLSPGKLVEQILPAEIALNTVWFYYARSKSGTQEVTFALMSDAIWEGWTESVGTTWSPFRYEPTRDAKLVMIRIAAPSTNTDDVYVDGILGVGWRRDVRVRETVNPPNLNVKLDTRASDANLIRTDVESEAGIYSKRVDIRYDNVGLAKDRTLATDYHAARLTDGTEFIDPRKIRALTSSDIVTAVQPTAAELNATVVQADKERIIGREAIIEHFSITFTGAGTATIIAPPDVKKAAIYGFLYYCQDDVVSELRFMVSKNVVGALATKGTCAYNFIGLSLPTGDLGEALVVYVGGATTVKGWVAYEFV